MSNKNVSPTYFVTQTNPEIFEVTPRPGGLVKIDLPPKRSRLKENAAKLRAETESAMKVGSKSRSRTSAKAKPSVSKTKEKVTTPSKKSLLTVTSMYEEPKDLDVDSCPRDYKVKRIIAATPWSVEFDEYLEPTEESKRIPDPFQDSVDMLAMSISVIMLLARGYDKISDTHFKWIFSYLDCIRDEFGQLPPNVQGILNHINQLTGGKIQSFLDDSEDPAELGDRTTAVKISAAAPDVIEHPEGSDE